MYNFNCILFNMEILNLVYIKFYFLLATKTLHEMDPTSQTLKKKRKKAVDNEGYTGNQFTIQKSHQ